MDSPAFSGKRRTALPPLLSWIRVVSALGLLLYALFLAHYMGAYAGGSDQSGYLNNARLLEQGRVITPMRVLPGLPPETLPPYTHVPLGFIPNRGQATLTPTYPMGLPLLILAVAKLTGWGLAPGLTLGFHALLGLWLVYRLGREAGLGAGGAWWGALLLAASPLYIFTSVQVMSDMPALVWATAAVLCAWKSRERTGLALLAGVALAIAVLVRPTNLLALLPMGLAMGFSLRRWLLLILGGLPGAIFQGSFNWAVYGRIFTTGYGYINPNFSPANAPATILYYALWLPVLLTPFIVLALGLPALARRQLRLVSLLAAWGLAYPFFYLFYSHTHDDWWYLRFLLPAFPPLIVAALLVAQALAARFKFPARSWWLVPAALAVIVHGAGWSRHLHALSIGRSEGVYAETAAWLQAHLPARATVAAMEASGALFYYTDFTLVRWDMISPADFQRIAAAGTAAGRPLYAVLFPFEVEEAEWGAFQKHLAGHWTQIGAVRSVGIWRYDSPPAP